MIKQYALAFPRCYEDIIMATINVLNSDVFENSFFFLRITENLMIVILFTNHRKLNDGYSTMLSQFL